jgi:hypothetical protein
MRWSSRILHNGELHDLYRSPSVNTMKDGIQSTQYVDRMGKMRTVYSIFVGNHPLRKLRRWNDNIKMDYRL